MLTNRDKKILTDIDRFRVLNRDQIAKLHFSRNKNATRTANFVLRRLRDKGYIRAETNHQPFAYVLANSNIKQGSQKIDHYLAIADIYLSLRATGELKRFNVEPKLGKKGTVEPDIFAIWDGWPWFIEVQLSNYTENVMQKKMIRYNQYYIKGHWKKLKWQPKEPLFPKLWVIGERKYDTTPLSKGIYVKWSKKAC